MQGESSGQVPSPVIDKRLALRGWLTSSLNIEASGTYAWWDVRAQPKTEYTRAVMSASSSLHAAERRLEWLLSEAR